MPTGGAVAVKGIKALHKWLIREHIEEQSFEVTCEKARGLAYPNEAGNDIQRQIDKVDRGLADKVKQFDPLKFVISGSIGRFIGKEADLQYLASTTACLSRYHPITHVTDVLCSMMLDEGGHEEHVSAKYNIQRALRKSVMSRVVNSIWLNVINAGHDLAATPDGLKQLHPHILDHDTFAGIVMGIERTHEDVVIRSDRYLADLTLWFLHHFHGQMTVIVGNKVCFEKKLGASTRVLRLLVNHPCWGSDNDTCFGSEKPIKASLMTSTGPHTFLSGTDDSTFVPRSFVRRAVYDVDSTSETSALVKIRSLNEEQSKQAYIVAKGLLTWLLEVNVQPDTLLSSLVLRAYPDGDTPTSWKIENLLKARPALLDWNKSGKKLHEPIMCRPIDQGTENARFCDADDDSAENISNFDIVKWFPSMNDFMTMLQEDCTCGRCRQRSDVWDCKPGCLRHIGLRNLSTLLAHGICDGFGARMVCGNIDYDAELGMINKLFGELLEEGLVRWNTWFELVACDVVGLAPDEFDPTADEGGTSWAAVQAGSLTITAPWLNLRRDISLEGSFSIKIVEGQMEGITNEVAIVQCEQGSAKLGKEWQQDVIDRSMIHSDVQEAFMAETSELESFSPFYMVSRGLYRLMTVVRVGEWVRCIDPSEVVVAKAACINAPPCEHGSHIEEGQVMRAGISVHGLEKIVSAWYSDNPSEYMIQASRVMSDHQKINSVLGMTPGHILVRNHGSTCLDCAVQLARRHAMLQVEPVAGDSAANTFAMRILSVWAAGRRRINSS